MMVPKLPKRTRERLAACEAVGLHYWADHPEAGHVWAIDDHQQAHVVRIIRSAGTAQHVCREQISIVKTEISLVETEECAGAGEAVAYTVELVEEEVDRVDYRLTS